MCQTYHETLARAIAAMVEALRKQMARQATDLTEPAESSALALWQGTVLGSLSREEIYDDVA